MKVQNIQLFVYYTRRSLVKYDLKIRQLTVTDIISIYIHMPTFMYVQLFVYLYLYVLLQGTSLNWHWANISLCLLELLHNAC